VTSFIEVRDISVPAESDASIPSLSDELIDQFGPGCDIEVQNFFKSASGFQCDSACKVILGIRDTGFRLVDITDKGSYSIALDIGTTNIAGVLYDNISKRELLSLSVENPQIVHGSDILTRLHVAMSGKYSEVRSLLMSGIDSLIERLCSGLSIRRESIHGLTVAGNTTMSHFFLGLDVSTIPMAPFAPLVKKPGFVRARDIGLDVHPEASVYVFPNAGSYVGGDIIAGIVASGMADSEDISVLIDVGTNAEIVVGNREWILVGAGAAGPALEEGISMAGRRAGEGIIYDVEIIDGLTRCHTFDGSEPRGICGSGMVSLVYELFHKGIIDEKGMLQNGEEAVTLEDGTPSFKLVCKGAVSSLTIYQTEIDNFLKSKAAMFTLLLVLLRTVGLEFRDIKKVYVAGALGTGINVEKALGIGMLPQWPLGAFQPVGNTSLEGTRLLLEDSSMLSRIDAIADSITYKHMHDDPEFMKEFMGAVFIPHTNPWLLTV